MNKPLDKTNDLFVLAFTFNVPFLLQVKWYRDTMLLDPNEFRLMEQFGIRHTLVLRKVAEEDFGNYSCSAENHLGKSRAFIEVSGKKMLHFSIRDIKHVFPCVMIVFEHF